MIKFADLKKLTDAGLITPEQKVRIAAAYNLKEDESRLLAIISIIGAALVACGIILLIASNWDDIPRGVKIASGLALMFGAHYAGWRLQESGGGYTKISEALHVVGSALFLGNIALVGQIYHLSSRPPNAILLWVLGIGALPWILRSRVQWFVFLTGLGIWFGMEINQRDSLLYFGNDVRQIAILSCLGLLYVGTGYVLRGTRYASFSGIAERLGLLGFLSFFFPMTWGVLYASHLPRAATAGWAMLALLGMSMALILFGLRHLPLMTAQWRWTWGAALAGVAALLGLGVVLDPGMERWYSAEVSYFRWFATVGMFVFCLIQVQVGIESRSEFMVNCGVLFIALIIVTTYLNLFGSMATTGAMFVVSGICLIAFGIYLEKKRRKLLARMHGEAASAEASPLPV